MSARRCPVCHRAIMPTRRQNIVTHWDVIGQDICPASGVEYQLALQRPTH